MKMNWITKCTVATLCTMAAMTASAASVAIEDFESESANNWESKGGEGSTASIIWVKDAKRGGGAGQVTFNIKSGSWAQVQKKIAGAEWLKLEPKAISFWLKGEGAGEVTVELEESYTYKWRVKVPLVDKEWHLVTLKLGEFTCDDKPAMSVPDLVAIKFVGFGGAPKFWVDDVQVECAK